MSSDTIYRVMVRETASRQPGGSSWHRRVVYCGPSLRDARVAYLREEAEDTRDRSHGNPCRETLIERHDAEPEDIEATEGEQLDIDRD